jgi:CBS domain-containing protein
MLDAVGFRLCVGQVMATNPVWRKSLSDWRRQIDGWIRRRESAMLLNCDIFFDFRHAYGDPELANELRTHVTAAVSESPQFLRHLFAIEAEHTVALGWFGRLRKEYHGDDRQGVVNLKFRGTLPLVEGARLLALKSGIPATSTLTRLDCLREQGAISAQDHDDLADAFRHMTRLLLRQQLQDFKAGRAITNDLPVANISQRDRKHLVASFRAIENLRATLTMEFAERQL